VLQLPATAIAITLALLSQTSWASSVGRVVEQTGPTEIVRNKKSLSSSVNTSVEMLDTIVTARAKAKLEFVDKTTVNITEQSKILIDDFVYDPKAGSGKLAMKMVQGTARYASGQIAKNSPQNVNITTPTATVAVRGTDFSMTVDELGRSLVMLLPSCDAKSCVTGSISVSNDAGEVILDVAYQATVVTSLTAPPTAPAVIQIDANNINNMLIVSPPPAVREALQVVQQTALDINFLNQDLLKFDELNVNYLETFRRLDVNFLDLDFLVNLLDLSNKQLSASLEAMSREASLLPSYDPNSGLRYFFNEDDSKVTVRLNTGHMAEVTVGVEHDAVVTINQAGWAVTQQINRGGTSIINIIQK
jgi:hypothetical protein